MIQLLLSLLAFVVMHFPASIGAQSSKPLAALEPSRPVQCPPSRLLCEDFDAVVFVHGIYGSRETFIKFDDRIRLAKGVSSDDHRAVGGCISPRLSNGAIEMGKR